MDKQPFQYHIPYADLAWGENGTPQNLEFDDCYYSNENGLAESEYVFFKLNEIEQRWNLEPQFVIAELGFGTGLNFLLTLKLWQRQRYSDRRLTFISFEKTPLTIADLKRAHRQFPDITSESEELLERLGDLHYGINLIHFAASSLQLMIVIGAASSNLPRMQFLADAWFLDGFAPAKNSSMWSEDLFEEIARHSANGCTASTFSAARVVKDSLQKAGFIVEKVPGYGKKRESLRATFTRTKEIQTRPHPKKVAIVGAGIAGCSLAYALTRRSVEVTLFETGDAPGYGASGNAVGMAKVDLSAVPDVRSELSVSGFSYLKQLCLNLSLPTGSFTFDGIFRSPQYGRLERFLARFEELKPDPNLVREIDGLEAADITDLPAMGSGLFFPSAGWIQPQVLCSALAQSSRLRKHTTVSSLNYMNKTWQITDNDRNSYDGFDAVFLANGHKAPAILSSPISGMTFNHGQFLTFKDAQFPSPTIPIIGPGYLINIGDTHYLGATYEHADSNADKKRQALLNDMADYLHTPGLATAKPTSIRRSVRCNSTDRLPLIGSWQTKETFAGEATLCLSQPLMLLAMGSKGLTSAPICAELLVSQLFTDPLPVFEEITSSLHFSRFYTRELRRS